MTEMKFIDLCEGKKASKKSKNRNKRKAKGIKGKPFDKKVKSKLTNIVKKNAQKMKLGK